MIIDTFELLKVLPFLTENIKEPLDYRRGYNQAVGDLMKLIRMLEEDHEDLDELKKFCPIWEKINKGKENVKRCYLSSNFRRIF